VSLWNTSHSHLGVKQPIAPPAIAQHSSAASKKIAAIAHTHQALFIHIGDLCRCFVYHRPSAWH
jgi:hypothetical protein